MTGRKAGRPTVGDRRLPIRLDAELHEAIKAAAARDGLTVSAWVRRVAAEALNASR